MININRYCKLLFIALILGSLVSCFNIDNYEAPNAKIEGNLINVETGEPMQTEQPDGCRIRLDDLSYENPVPLYFWVMSSGHYRNKALFEGEYSVSPTDGAFFPVEPKVVKLDENTNIDFEVVPFLQVDLQKVELGESGSGEAKVIFTIKRSQTPVGIDLESKTIAEAFILCCEYPVVSYYNGGYNQDNSVQRIFSRTSDSKIETTVYEQEIPNLSSGKTYYVRIAGRSSTSYNPLKRYNYSETIKFVAP